MSFDSPAWLTAIPILSLLWIPLIVRFRRLEPGIAAWLHTAAPGKESIPAKEKGGYLTNRASRRRFLFAEFCQWLAASCLVVALAGLHGGERTVAEYRTGLDAVFALDISRSMDAEDIPPSRLALAVGLMRAAAETAPGIRTAVVLGKGSAVLALPLTDDLAGLRSLCDSVSSSSLSAPGSDLEKLITVGAAAFSETNAARRLLVVLSDGESLSGAPESAIDRLKQAAVRTVFIGVGTVEGAEVPQSDGGFVRGDDGAVVHSQLQETALRRLADRSGGTYIRADAISAGADLAAVINSSAATTPTAEGRIETIDLYPLFLAIAVICYVVGRSFDSASGAGSRS